MNVITEEPRNAEPSWTDLEAARTPHFFQRNHYPFPEAHQHLSLPGRTLSMDELRALPAVDAEVTLECAGNGRKFMDPLPAGTPWGWRAVSNACWTGVPLVDVIGELPVGTVELVFQGGDDDKYARSLPLAEALRPEVLLVHTMNGQPLPQAHGGPLRLLVPGWYAMASVKWLTGIRAVSEPFQGYYQVEDYQIIPEQGPSRPATRMLPRAMVVTPEDQSLVTGAVAIEGWAWSGFGQVVRVDVRVGDQSWLAELAPSRGPYAWRAFSAQLELPVGEHILKAFAHDSEGNCQPVEAVWNRDGYENNSARPVSITVR